MLQPNHSVERVLIETDLITIQFFSFLKSNQVLQVSDNNQYKCNIKLHWNNSNLHANES
jgi:hypothetical protein